MAKRWCAPPLWYSRSELDDTRAFWSSQNKSSSIRSIITVTALFACTLVLPSSGNQNEPNQCGGFYDCGSLCLRSASGFLLKSLCSRPCSPRTKVCANHFSNFINDKFTNHQWYFHSWPHPNVLSMTKLQTVNAILIRDCIRFLTNQIQNKLVTAFNCRKKPMSRSVLFEHTRY